MRVALGRWDRRVWGAMGLLGAVCGDELDSDDEFVARVLGDVGDYDYDYDFGYDF